MRIRVNDEVVVLSGNDRGERGKVLSVQNAEGTIVVEGVNRVYKHVRRSQRNPQGGRLSKELPLPVAKVMLVCTKCGKPTRVGLRFRDDGAKERYCKKCGAGQGDVAPAKSAYAKKS